MLKCDVKLGRGRNVEDAILDAVDEAVEVRIEDDGIGPYEFWGYKGYDSRKVARAYLPEPFVLDVTNALEPGETPERQIAARLSGTKRGVDCGGYCDECPLYRCQRRKYEVWWEARLVEIRREHGRVLVAYALE